MMRGKGFTLIELMVVLAIIVIIATASVPQVQLWIARNRGLTAVTMIISDFSKAKAMAEYSVKISESDRLNLKNGDFQRSKSFTAMVFKASSYSIVQQPDDIGWESVTPLKTSKFPINVSVAFVNGAVATDNPGPSLATVVFSSTGRLKNTSGGLVPFGADMGNLPCGSVQSPLDGSRIFYAKLKSQINSSNALWYRIEIDTEGESFVCMEPGTASDPKSNFEEATANVVDL